MATQITRLRLTDWRNFRSLDVALRPRMFLFGPNASGKSNLLDALRFLRDVAAPGGGLTAAVRARRGMARIRSLHGSGAGTLIGVSMLVERPAAGASRSDGDPTPGPAGTDPPPVSEWRYELEFAGDDGGPHQPGPGGVRVVREVVVRDGEEVLRRPDEDDRRDAELLGQTHVEQVARNAAFRPMCRALAGITSCGRGAGVAGRPGVDGAEDPSCAFIGELAALPAGDREAAMHCLQDALRAAVPDLDRLGCRRDATGRPHLTARFRHWNPDAADQTEEEFSEGTLNLAGLVYSLLTGGSPLLLEEPELSLHKAVVRRLPALLASASLRTGRQFLVTTHADEMLADEGVAPEELLLLVHGEGTATAVPAADDPVMLDLAGAGQPLCDAVEAATRPEGVDQLRLFPA